MQDDVEWKGKYKSEILMVCHIQAKAWHEIGLITDKEMREYDRDCLVSLSKTASKNKATGQKPAPMFAGSSPNASR